jgi:putative ABC transport system permease protein
VLRVPPALGRAFTADEDNQGVKVCVISDGLWRRRFGADPGVLGRTVYLERVAYKIVGVMPRTFEFPLRGGLSTRSAALWVPMSLTPEERETRADNWDYNGIGRLKPGVTAAQASADVNAIAQHIVNDLLPADREGFVKFTALAQAMAPQVSGNVRPLVLALASAVACVLLIACVNVANLLLARGAHRRREMAVRAALGAGRFRLLRQLVTETLLFAGIGAAAGGLLAWWSTRMLTTAIPARFAVLGLARFNWPVLAFTAALSVGAAILAGIVPGLAASGAARMNGINERGSSPGAGHRRLRSTLVVAEIALALVLLVGAGLLARTFRDLLRADPGFQPEGAIGAYVSLPEAAYPDTPRERQIYRDLLERLHAFPDVEFAATGTALPLNGTRSQRAFWPDQYVPPPGAGFNIAAMTTVSPEYLQAIGATLLRGRYFTREDDAGAPPVAVVTEALARQYWPGQDPVGKRLKWGIKESPAPWLTVVGVVADVKQQSLDAPGAVQVFVPADQVESSISESLRAEFTNRQLRAMYLVVRGRGGLDRLAGELRDTVRALDPQLAVTGLAPLTDAITASAAPQRFNMLLMAGFAAIAVLLAVVGLYGLIAYSVAQRTREIGIRMAMGAMAGGVVRMIVRDGMVLAASGVAIGTAAAAALAPALGTLLFGVKPLDPPTFAGVAALLLAVAAVATWVPARRATRIDPTRALRAE